MQWQRELGCLGHVLCAFVLLLPRVFRKTTVELISVLVFWFSASLSVFPPTTDLAACAGFHAIFGSLLTRLPIGFEPFVLSGSRNLARPAELEGFRGLTGLWRESRGRWSVRGLIWDVVTRGCNKSEEKCKEKKKRVYINHRAGLKHFRLMFRNLPSSKPSYQNRGLFYMYCIF